MNKTTEGEKHFTASVWILTRSNPKKMLLIHHNKFDRWMQPGGHIEKMENPVEAAIRETLEETGMDISFLLEEVEVVNDEGKFLPVPRFIMEQTIPVHSKEPQHFHIDIEYVVEVDEQALNFNKLEASNIGWFTRDEILKLSVHEDTKVVVAELMG